MACAGSALSRLIPGEAAVVLTPPDRANSLSDPSHAAGFPAANIALRKIAP
jgi:hypothetical protein